MDSNDPYLVVRSEVEASLQSALALHGSFRRIAKTLPQSSHATSEELNWSKDELKGNLTALESDLDELESSVDVVVRNPAGFGVTSDEIQRRRQFISRVRDEIQSMRKSIASSEPQSSRSPRPLSSSSFPSEGRSRYTYDDGGDHSKGDVDGADNEDDDDRNFPPSHGHQQQQFYMETQDRMLDSISGTVSTLKAQAGLMGREVLDQVGMLEDLEAGVDRSQNRLDRATKRMNEFIRKNKNSKSSWTIFLLTIVLSFLLLAIILV